jgi:peroxiredoxin Q/BCP
VVVLGASADSPEANKKFKAKNDFPFSLLSDPELKLAKAYGAFEEGKKTANRAAVVIDGKGKIVKWWPKVDAKAFPEQVLAELPEAPKKK